MVQIQFRSKEKERLAAVCYAMCASFVGWEAFVDNTVLVANPREYEGHDRAIKSYEMSAYIGPDNSNDSVIVIDIDGLSDEQLQIYSRSQDVIDKCVVNNVKCEYM